MQALQNILAYHRLVPSIKGFFLFESYLSLARRAPICSNAYGGWFAPRPRHSVRMTYWPNAAREP